MTYRKTWFSCVLWILYTILCVISLVLLAGGVWTAYLAGIPYVKDFPAAVIAPLAGLSDSTLTLLGLLILPVTALLYWVIRVVSRAVRKKCMWKERTVWIWESIIVFLALAGGVCLRVMYAGFAIPMAGNEAFLARQVTGMEYYDMAVVTAGNTLAYTTDRISYLYVLCLSAALSFLGNKIASAVVLQIFLQITGMLLAYAVTRKLAGRLPACIVLIYLACSFSCLKMLTCFGPEWLFFVLYMTGMLIAAGFIQSYCANRLRKPAALLGAVAVGAAAGGLAYMDLAAAPLMLMLVAVATGRKKRQETMPVYNSAGISATVIITAIAAYILVLSGASYLGIYGEKADLFHLRVWYEYSMGFTNMRPYMYDIYLIGLLIIPAAFLVFEFFSSGREQNYMLWILLCIIVAPTPMAVIGTHQFGLLSLYIWAVLAGLGLQNCIFGGRSKVMQAVIEEINSAAESAGEEESLKEIGKLEEAKMEGIKEPEDAGKLEEIEHTEAVRTTEKVESPEETEAPEKLEKSETSEAVTAQEAPRYIENPLPLPKKHVKKEMDYQYPVEEKDMKYDIEVPENDDFDIL